MITNNGLAFHYESFHIYSVFFITGYPTKYIPCPEKEVPLYFRLQLSHFLFDFYNFYSSENKNEYSTIACNLLTE